MKYANKLKYRTKHDVKLVWRNTWNMVIPIGTNVYYTSQGGFHCAARVQYLTYNLDRTDASKPNSMFNFDATHRWVWLSPDDVEQVQ